MDQCNIYNLKKYSIINNNSYKNNIGIMASMMLVCSLLKYIDMPLFKMCVVICAKHLVSLFSIYEGQTLVPCIDVFCVGTWNWRLALDGDLSLQHVMGFMFMDNL